MKHPLIALFVFTICYVAKSQDTIPNDSIHNDVLEKEVFVLVDKPAAPPEGLGAFFASLDKIKRYPAEARKKGIEGKVLVEFVVNQDGGFSDIKVQKGIGGGCDEEAVRVFQEYTKKNKWTPPSAGGNPARMKMLIPLTFKLQ